MKTIRNIIEDCAEDYYPYHEYSGAYEDNNKKSLDQALKEIEEVILNSLPELPKVRVEIQSQENYLNDEMHRNGFQQALEDTRKAIKSIIGGK